MLRIVEDGAIAWELEWERTLELSGIVVLFTRYRTSWGWCFFVQAVELRRLLELVGAKPI
jgi:hypothetical protein